MQNLVITVAPQKVTCTRLVVFAKLGMCFVIPSLGLVWLRNSRLHDVDGDRKGVAADGMKLFQFEAEENSKISGEVNHNC